MKLPFWTNCVNSTAEIIYYLNDNAESISYDQFRKKTDCKEIFAQIGYRVHGDSAINDGSLWINKDPCVSFSRLKIGKHAIYFFTWSAIEYIFASLAAIQALEEKVKGNGTESQIQEGQCLV